MTITFDSSSVTFDSSAITFDGGTYVPPPPTTDTTPPQRLTADVINNTRIVGQRGRLESMLLVVLAVAAYSGATDVRAAAKQTFIDTPYVDTAWKGNPLLIVLTPITADIVLGNDNFLGWPPPEPPFIQQRTVPLITGLTSYAAYNPAPDVIYGSFKRTPYFADYPPFVQERSRELTNLTIKPLPPADLTTQIRQPKWFVESTYVDPKNSGAWHIVLLPGLAPPPPPPPPPVTGPVWPPPSSITNLPCRGAWELPGGSQALWVIGSGCFLMTVATAPTATAFSTFKLARVGTLSTSVGPVCIRDNGPGGTVVIVDGPFGYFYTIQTKKFNQITDPQFLGADRVAFIDGWWIFNQPGTQNFYTPNSTYSTVFNASNFALKDGATDKLVTLYENKEELWLVGEKTTEVWYDAGGTYFAFQRLVSTMLQVGCSAKHSIARFNSQQSDGLVWLSKSERGQNVVVKITGFTAEVISPPAINDAIANYTRIDDAIGYTYQEDGHEFYMITFPSAVNEYGGTGMTWCYDGSTESWHQRCSYEPYSGLYNRHRSNCFLSFQNQRLVGDYQNGSIYNMTRSAYTDAGWPLVGWRRAPHIWDGGARERVFMAMLQIDFKPGQGTPAGLGSDPQAVLSISRDGGTTFGQELRRSIGKIGQFLNRAIWRRLSFSRDAVVDVKIYDPVNRDIVGATLRKMNNDG